MLNVLECLDHMAKCIESCKESACAPDIDEKNGCNQMYSCSHACKMRQLGLDETTCKANCKRNGTEGCQPTVNGYQFWLCNERNREGCSSYYPTVEECEMGCSSYPGK